MRVELTWLSDEERCVRWQFHGTVGVVDYVVPLNDTATRCVLSDHDAVNALIDVGWAMPFPNRSFKYMEQAILAAPPNLRRVVIVTRNLLTYAVLQVGLMNDRLRDRGVMITTSYAMARQQLGLTNGGR